METFSALLAICAGNSPVIDEFLAQRPVTRSFDVFFDLRLNKRLSKQWQGWWFEMPSRPLWHHCNGQYMAGNIGQREPNRSISQIPWCTSPISHNAPLCNRNVHTCAHFCYKWCIVGYLVPCEICEMDLSCQLQRSDSEIDEEINHMDPVTTGHIANQSKTKTMNLHCGLYCTLIQWNFSNETGSVFFNTHIFFHLPDLVVFRKSCLCSLS